MEHIRRLKLEGKNTEYRTAYTTDIRTRGGYYRISRDMDCPEMIF